MSLPQRPRYVLCIAGARVVNKRMAMFFDGVRDAGLSLRILTLPRGSWEFDKSETLAVVHRCGRFSADIGAVRGRQLASVMCFHWFVLPLAVFIGFVRQVPVLYDEHDHYELNTLEGNGPGWKRRWSARLVRLIHRAFLPHVTLVTCIHQWQHALQRHLEQWQSRVLEVHNYPATIWRTAGMTRHPAGPVCFVYLGGIFREKGVEASAVAFQRLQHSSQQPVELHVFGDGDRDLMAELSAGAGVTVHRAVTPGTFREFVQSRRCCGLALLAGTPRYRLVGTNCTKLYEYLALGMPVIATRVGEFPEQVEGRGVGLVVDSSMDPIELSAAMHRLAHDESFFERCATRALTMMSDERMTWEHEWTRIAAYGVISGQRAA